MPFTSKSQMKACFAKRKAAEKKGEEFTWDCNLWARETPNIKNLPEYKSK